ncbi:hypothetical protein H0264_03430 [Nocardia huaxiensis]|uniref:DUF6779 domain-containing protein n=1 Tax=Nocardia huaxiensis TaxID=2755382 RepID=A0A7D6VF11_9NOCA|nr:DUF6779 domain-containing protein [Nocardia huaxiensis]QLY31417.1 hypothetical protein H0264_03430 [Nocardia huaxiensis]
MVSPSRSSTSRRRREDAGKFFTGVLLLLGLVASIFLVFSDNVQMVRVGLVTALWAAAIGALAATRFRRESAIDKAKVGDLQKVYQLQLEREVAARREYELGVEARIRRETGADAEEMAALRAELTVLRESLQRLFEGDLPFDRPALRADAVRVQELPARDGSGSANPANDNWHNADSGEEPWDPWSAPLGDDIRGRVTPVFDADHPEPPVFATPYDDPVTAETSIVVTEIVEKTERVEVRHEFTQHHPEPAPPTVDATPPAQSPNTRHTEPIHGPEPLQQVPWFETEHPAGNTPTDPSVPRNGNGAGPAAPAPAPATPMGTASSRRRRRADEDSESTGQLSVAEIMANLRSESGR